MLADLQDDRRALKTWLPDDDRDVTSGRVTEGPDGKPRCALHGAMNRVDPVRSLWRCSEFRCGVGAEIVTGEAPGLELSKPPDLYQVSTVETINVTRLARVIAELVRKGGTVSPQAIGLTLDNGKSWNDQIEDWLRS
jgi:hypothetical protein